MYQDAVRVPMGDWSQSRLRNLSETDKRRNNSHVQSGFGKKIANWVGRDLAYPDNVLHMATECSNRGHSATFPVELPVWFIKLFTQPGDLVLDPFLGSGTTSVAAKQLGRCSIGIEMNSEYFQVAQERMESTGVEFLPSLLTDISKQGIQKRKPEAIQQLIPLFSQAGAVEDTEDDGKANLKM